ncbi:MAG: DUF86 domain-containing protein [Bacteroidales bacterium]|jgi:uncharacterized protein with HEPN domain|nr:DUF86 domain-containing protein [Bacteroidales bacterium]
MREHSKDKSRLEDILKSIQFIEEYSDGISYETFVADTMRYYAIMKNVEIVGEAANMLTRDFRETNTELPWREIIGMRNVLVHGYANISNEQLWSAVKDDIPVIKSAVTNYINNVNWMLWEQTPQTYSEIDSTLYKKAIETAKKLKKMGLTVEQIMKATELSEKEIEKI